MDQCLEYRALVALTEDEQAGLALLPKQRDGPDQGRKVLLPLEATDPDHDRRFTRGEPRMRKLRLPQRHESRPDDRIEDHLDSVTWQTDRAGELVGHVAGDRDDAVGSRIEPCPECEPEAGAGRLGSLWQAEMVRDHDGRVDACEPACPDGDDIRMTECRNQQV